MIIILAAGDAETIMLSAHAESIILSAQPAESIIVSAPPAESMILSALRNQARRIDDALCLKIANKYIVTQ